MNRVGHRDGPERVEGDLEEPVVLGTPEETHEEGAPGIDGVGVPLGGEHPEIDAEAKRLRGLAERAPERRVARLAPDLDLGAAGVAHEEDLDPAARLLLRDEARRENARVVEHHEGTWRHVVGELGDAVMPRLRVAGEQHHASVFPIRGRELGDALGGQVVAQEVDAHPLSAASYALLSPDGMRSSGAGRTKASDRGRGSGHLAAQEACDGARLEWLGHERHGAAVRPEELALAQVIGAREHDANLREALVNLARQVQTVGSGQHQLEEHHLDRGSFERREGFSGPAGYAALDAFDLDDIVVTVRAKPA